MTKIETFPKFPDKIKGRGKEFTKHPTYRLLIDMAKLFDSFHRTFLSNAELMGDFLSDQAEVYMWMHGRRYKKHGKEIFHITDYSLYRAIQQRGSFMETGGKALEPQKKKGEVLGIIHNHPLQRGELLDLISPSGIDFGDLPEETRRVRGDNFNGVHVILRTGSFKDILSLDIRDIIRGNTCGWYWECDWDKANKEKKKALQTEDLHIYGGYYPKTKYWVPIIYENELPVLTNR